MVLDLVVVGLLGALVIMLAAVLLQLVRLHSTLKGSRLERASRKALDDYRILRRNLRVTMEQDVEAFRSDLREYLKEAERLSQSVQEVTRRVDRAAGKLEDDLTIAVHRHVGTTLEGRVKPLLDEMDRLLNRLEARGASPFKTAQAKILEYLRSRGDIGGKHTAEEQAVECLPVHERDLGQEALDDLIRKGLVVEKPTGYGRQVSLNTERLDDIRRVIDGENI